MATRWPSRERLRDAGYAVESSAGPIRVMLSILVDRDGQVERVDIFESNDPGRIYNNAAVDAVRSASFVPGSTDGDPQRMWTLLSIDFPPQPTARSTALERDTGVAHAAFRGSGQPILERIEE